MELDQFLRYSYRPFEVVEYKTNRMEDPMTCLILAVNFDNHMFHLDNINGLYHDFWAHCSHVNKPKPKKKVKK